MHAHLEIIMPPTESVEEKVAEIMEPFSEHEREDGCPNPYGFWDFYIVGGRFHGTKLTQQFDQNRVEEFFSDLKRHEITVSGLIAGKQEIKPEDQIPEVDRRWNAHFPESSFTRCPFFQHSGNQYVDNPYYPDVMELKDVPGDLVAARIMIAVPDILDEERIRLKTMVQTKIWNGVNFLNTDWNGEIQTALDSHKKDVSLLREDVQNKLTPNDDWLVITVDYHS